MVALTSPLTAVDGGALIATDFGRKCGDVFAATNLGVFRAEASSVDGGLPGWVPLAQVNASLGSKDALRLYETHDDFDRLFVGTKTGQVVELTTSPCP